MRVRGRGFPYPIPLLPWLPARWGWRYMEARNYWPSELEGLVREAGLEVRHRSSVFPVLDVWPWLPPPLIAHHRQALPALERAPVIGRFGLSTLVLARRPCCAQTPSPSAWDRARLGRSGGVG